MSQSTRLGNGFNLNEFNSRDIRPFVLEQMDGSPHESAILRTSMSLDRVVDKFHVSPGIATGITSAIVLALTALSTDDVIHNSPFNIDYPTLDISHNDYQDNSESLFSKVGKILREISPFPKAAYAQEKTDTTYSILNGMIVLHKVDGNHKFDPQSSYNSQELLDKWDLRPINNRAELSKMVKDSVTSDIEKSGAPEEYYKIIDSITRWVVGNMNGKVEYSSGPQPPVKQNNVTISNITPTKRTPTSQASNNDTISEQEIGIPLPFTPPQPNYGVVKQHLDEETEGGMGGLDWFLQSFGHDSTGYFYVLPKYERREGVKDMGTISDFMSLFWRAALFNKFELDDLQENSPDHNRIVEATLVPATIEIQKKVYGESFNPNTIPQGTKIYYELSESAKEKYNLQESGAVTALEALSGKNNTIKELLALYGTIGKTVEIRQELLRIDSERRLAWYEAGLANNRADSLDTALETAINLSDEEKRKLREEADQAKGEAEDYKTKYENKTTEFKTAEAGYKRTIEQITFASKEELEKFRKALEIAHSIMEGDSTHIVDLEGLISAKDSSISTLKSEITDIENQLYLTQDSLFTTRTELDTTRSAKKEAEEDRDHYNGLYDQSGLSNTELGNKIASLDSVIQRNKVAADSLRGEIYKRDQKVKKLDKDLKEKSDTLTQAEKDRGEYKTQRDDVIRQRDRYKKQRDYHQGQSAIKDTTITGLEKDVTDLKSAAGDSSTVIQTRTDERDAARGERDNAKGLVGEWRGKYLGESFRLIAKFGLLSRNGFYAGLGGAKGKNSYALEAAYTSSKTDPISGTPEDWSSPRTPDKKKTYSPESHTTKNALSIFGTYTRRIMERLGIGAGAGVTFRNETDHIDELLELTHRPTGTVLSTDNQTNQIPVEKWTPSAMGVFHVNVYVGDIPKTPIPINVEFKGLVGKDKSFGVGIQADF